MVKRLFFLFLAPVLVLICSCSRPEKKVGLIYHNTYKTIKTLIITSEKRKTEGWIHVQEKDVERSYGRKDRLYLVYSKNKLVGFVTADRRTFKCKFPDPPYDVDRVDKTPINEYSGTWRTLEIAVQDILGLHYPVTVY